MPNFFSIFKNFILVDYHSLTPSNLDKNVLYTLHVFQKKKHLFTADNHNDTIHAEKVDKITYIMREKQTNKLNQWNSKQTRNAHLKNSIYYFDKI